MGYVETRFTKVCCSNFFKSKKDLSPNDFCTNIKFKFDAMFFEMTAKTAFFTAAEKE